jgi:hypothetical protein
MRQQYVAYLKQTAGGLFLRQGFERSKGYPGVTFYRSSIRPLPSAERFKQVIAAHYFRSGITRRSRPSSSSLT